MIMTIINNILERGYDIIWMSCLSVLFVVAEPIILAREYVLRQGCNFSKTKEFFNRLFSCAMCSGFWISLILTMDIQMAVIISITSEFLYRTISSGKLI